MILNLLKKAFNNFHPSQAFLLNITNIQNEMVSSPLLEKRLTHKNGFMLALESNQSYTFVYDQVTRPTNISFTGTFFGLKPNDYLILKFSLKQDFHKFIIVSCIFNSKNNLVSNFKRSFSFSSLQSKLLN